MPKTVFKTFCISVIRMKKQTKKVKKLVLFSDTMI